MHPGPVASRRVTRVTHRCLVGAGRVVLDRFHQFRSQQRLLWQASAGVRERAIESHWRPLERRHDGTQPIALIASQRQACWSTTPRSKGASFTRPSVRQRAPRPTRARLSRFGHVQRKARSAAGQAAGAPQPGRGHGCGLPGGVERRQAGGAGRAARAGARRLDARGLQRGPGAVAQHGGRAGGGGAPFHDCGQQRQAVEGDGAGGAPPHGRSLGSWPSGTRAGGVPIHIATCLHHR